MNSDQFQQLLTQAQQGPTRFNVGGVEYVLNAVSLPARNTLQHVFENVAELTAIPPEKTSDDSTDTGSGSGGKQLDMFKDKATEPDMARSKIPWKS